MSIRVIDIVVERRGCILLIKRGDFWILPGGELQEGESELDCLDRVVSKEMNDKVACIFKKLEKTINGTSLVRSGEVEVTIYVGDISSEKMSDIKDCNAHWFSKESVTSLRLSNIAKDVLRYYFSSAEDN